MFETIIKAGRLKLAGLSAGAKRKGMVKPMAEDRKAGDKRPEEKKKALDLALSGIEKQFGKGSVMILGENARMNVEHIPTGSLSLDIALGIGGVPRGRIVEIFGPESSGKTTVALHIIAEAQKADGIAAFIDAEHALDPEYSRKLGVDVDSLLVSQPDTGEQALEIAEALVKSNAIDVIVVDSVAALVPKAEIDGHMGESQVGSHARLMSHAMRKLAGVIGRSNCVAVFINQLREKIGITYGNPETTTGGRALKFYSSVRLEVRRGEQLKNGSEIYGSRTKVKVVKNKVAPPFKTAEFDILYGVGISRLGEIVDLGVDYDVITKSGSWYSYGDVRMGQGRDMAREYIKNTPGLEEDLMEKIKKAVEENKGRPAKGGRALRGRADTAKTVDVNVSAEDFED